MIKPQTKNAEKSLQTNKSQNKNNEGTLLSQNLAIVNNSIKKQNINLHKSNNKKLHTFHNFYHNLPQVIKKKNKNSFIQLAQGIKRYKHEQALFDSFIDDELAKIPNKVNSNLQDLNKNAKKSQFILDENQKFDPYNKTSLTGIQLRARKTEAIQKSTENYLLKKKQPLNINFSEKNQEYQRHHTFEYKNSKNQIKEDLKRKLAEKSEKYKQINHNSRSKYIKVNKIQKKIGLPLIKRLNLTNINSLKKFDAKKLKTQIYDEDYKRNKIKQQKANLRDSRMMKVASINDFQAQVHRQQEMIRSTFVLSRHKNRSHAKTQQSQEGVIHNYKKIFNSKIITKNSPIQIQQINTKNKFKKLIDYSKIKKTNQNITKAKINDNLQNQMQLDFQFLMSLKQNQTCQVNQLLKQSNIQKIIQNVIHSEPFSKIPQQNETKQKYNNIDRQFNNHEEVDFFIRNKARSFNKFKDK